MTKKLIINSIDNEDWNGTWLKGEVEHEMRECENVPSEENDLIYGYLDTSSIAMTLEALKKSLLLSASLRLGLILDLLTVKSLSSRSNMKRYIAKLPPNNTWSVCRTSKQPEGISVTRWKAAIGKFSDFADSNEKLFSKKFEYMNQLVDELKIHGFDKGKAVDAAFPMYEIVKLKKCLSKKCLI